MSIPLANFRSFLILALASLALLLPAIFIGIQEDYDLPQHLRFAVTYHEAFLLGNPFPAFGWSDNLGYGSVGIRFYPPLVHIFMGLVQFVTSSWYDTLWITMLTFMFLGSVGAYFFALEMLPRTWALSGAILYMVLPYHLWEIFQAFLLSEFAAAAILPFCFLFLHRLLRRQRIEDAAFLACSVSLLILAHLPSAIMGSIALAVYAVPFLSKRNLSARRLLLVAGSAFATAVATSAYWLRMVRELEWVKHNTTKYYATGHYNYSIYFFPTFLINGDDYFPLFFWIFDLTIAATLILLIPAVIAFARKCVPDSVKAVSLPLFLVAVVSAWMTSIISKPLWDSVPLLQKLQFPFRWLSILSFAAAMLFPVGIRFVIFNGQPITRKTAYPLAALALFVFIFDATQIVIPSVPVPRSEIARRVTEISQTLGCECWWPIWAKKEALNHLSKIDAGSRETQISAWLPEKRELQIGPGEAADVRLALFYYPHWQIRLNDVEATLKPASDGAIMFRVPPGPVRVSLEFREPSAVVYSRPFSLAILAFLPLFGIFVRLYTQKLNQKAAPTGLENE